METKTKMIADTPSVQSPEQSIELNKKIEVEEGESNFGIDPEFETLIPPLNEDELEKLEKSLLSEIVREPLVVGVLPIGKFLVDGHHRHKIGEKHKIKFKIIYKVFANKDEAKLWMFCNQLGKRNLIDYDRAIIALAYSELFEKLGKKNLKTHTKQGYQKSDKPVNTNKEVGKMAGLSHDTIAKVKVIREKASPETKLLLSNKKTSINKVYKKLKGVNKSDDDLKEENKLERWHSFPCPSTIITAMQLYLKDLPVHHLSYLKIKTAIKHLISAKAIINAVIEINTDVKPN
jgi:hypothetical protein